MSIYKELSRRNDAESLKKINENTNATNDDAEYYSDEEEAEKYRQMDKSDKKQS